MIDLVLIAALGIAFAGCPKDRPDESREPQVSRQPSKVGSDGNKSEILDFPDELHVEDESVNDFVARAMSICGGGKYEPFRLLWSAREEPLPKSQFEEGWQAVNQIRVRGLRQARIADQTTGLPRAQDADRNAGEQPRPDGKAESDEATERRSDEATRDQNRDREGAEQDSREAAKPRGEEVFETVYLVLAEVQLDPNHPAAKGRPHREVVLMLVQEHGQWRIAKPPDPMRDWIREQTIGS